MQINMRKRPPQGLHTLDELTSYINGHRGLVLNNLNPESLDVYVFLSKRFSECDASKDRVFQFVFRSFYRLDWGSGSSPAKIYGKEPSERLAGVSFGAEAAYPGLCGYSLREIFACNWSCM